jgi:uncharacterized coiled-coil protein SlyX
MRAFMRWSIYALCFMPTEGVFANDRTPAGSLQMAQALSPAVPQTKQTPPKQIAPKQPAIQARSTVPTTEQENKQLKERVAKQDTEIRTLNARLERYTKLSKSQAEQINKLTKQIGDMTKKGGSLVRAYCESDTVSWNTAGATSNCGSNGYQCEPVSGLCKTVCSKTTDCAPRYVCDPGPRKCIAAR